MAIPIRAVGTLATASNMVGPILEYAKGEINRLTEEATLGTQETQPRAVPTHVGIGLEISNDWFRSRWQPIFKRLHSSN